MRWILEHRQAWRKGILALLLVAFIGPWVFDRINVPVQYPCSVPTVRLEGDFCGMPMPGFWILIVFVAMPVSIFVELVTIGAGRPDFGSQFALSMLIGLGLLALVLPFFRTLVLVLRGDRPRLPALNWVIWVLAAGMGLWVGLQTPPRVYWELWGVWLFMGLAICGFILELLVFIAARKARDGVFGV